MNKIVVVGLLLLIVASVSAMGFFEDNRETAEILCDRLDGQVIFFGQVAQINTGVLHYESICFYMQEIDGIQTPSLRYELID